MRADRMMKAISPETFEFTVNVNGVKYDVYWFILKGKVGQLAFCMEGDTFVLAMLKAGRMTQEEVEQYIAKGVPKQ